MTIEKITYGKTLGANAWDKIKPQKINEIIDAVNDITDGTYDALTVETLVATTSVSTDSIIEETAAAGVTIDSVLAKDGTIALVDGAVGNLSVKIGADLNNGLYGVSDTQLGVAVEGTLVGGFNTAGLFTGTISEQVAAAGVNVDGVACKDGGITLVKATATQITSQTTDVTCDAPAGAITTFTLSWLAQQGGSFTLNNSFITPTSVVMTDVKYNGVYITDGIPLLYVGAPGNGTIVITILNAHAANALNGTALINFIVT